LASLSQAEGDHPKVRALLEELEELGRGSQDKSLKWTICAYQGHLLLETGDTAAARPRYEEGLALRRAAEDRGAVAWALLEVGHAAWLQGEPVVTQSHAVEALGLFQARDDKEGLLAALESLAVAALAQERKEHAARLLGAVEALREALKLSGPDWWRRPRERMADAAAVGPRAGVRRAGLSRCPVWGPTRSASGEANSRQQRSSGKAVDGNNRHCSRWTSWLQ
jgi:dsDNA-binding SOS-regulon protein